MVSLQQRSVGARLVDADTQLAGGLARMDQRNCAPHLGKGAAGAILAMMTKSRR
jgi:hypothetical protein